MSASGSYLFLVAYNQYNGGNSDLYSILIYKNGAVVASQTNEFTDAEAINAEFTFADANVSATDVFDFRIKRDTLYVSDVLMSPIFTVEVRKITDPISTFALPSSVTLPPTASPAVASFTAISTSGLMPPLVGASSITVQTAGNYEIGVYSSLDIPLGAAATIAIRRNGATQTQVYLGATFTGAWTYGSYAYAWLALNSGDVITIRWVATGVTTSTAEAHKGFIRRMSESEFTTFRVTGSQSLERNSSYPLTLSSISTFGSLPPLVTTGGVITTQKSGIYRIYSCVTVTNNFNEFFYYVFYNSTSLVGSFVEAGKMGYNQACTSLMFFDEQVVPLFTQTFSPTIPTMYSVANTQAGAVMHIANDYDETCDYTTVSNANCESKRLTTFYQDATFANYEGALESQDIGCGDNGKGLRGFQAQVVDGQFYYEFECLQFNDQNVAPTGTRLSAEQTYSATYATAFQGINMSCNDTQVIATFEFKLDVPNVVWYEYRCMDVKIPITNYLACLPYSTSATAISPNYTQLALHDVQCPLSDQGLQYVKLVTPTPTTFRYDYTCCRSASTLAPTPPTSFPSASPTLTPLTFIQNGAKLTGTGGSGTPRLGRSSAISADGNTAVAGAPVDSSNTGAVWVFTRSSSVWTQQGSKLVGTGAVGAANQGFSVALSYDGNTLASGGYADNSNIGAVWIWTRSSGVWTQQGSKLVGTGNTGISQQGYDVALSSLGDTLVVGGIADNTGFGATWVWTRTAGVWTQQGSKLVGTGATGTPSQGTSVDVSGDGDTLAIGGRNDNFQQGAVWIFTRSAGTWTQQGSKLVGTGASFAAMIGDSVSISGDGNTMMAGGSFDVSVGAAWVWTRSGGVWTQQGSKLVGWGGIGGSRQGFSCSLSHDGNLALIGGAFDDTNVGAVWVWKREGGTWMQSGRKLVGSGYSAPTYQGISLDLSLDGSTAIVGGWQDSSDQGAVWIFNNTDVPQPLFIQNGPAFLTGVISLGAAISADGNTAFSGAAGGLGTTVTVYVRSGGVWSIQASLTPSDAVSSPNSFGASIACSDDGNTVAVGATGEAFTVGATWVFVRSSGVWSQQGLKLVGTGGVGVQLQGFSCAMSRDGNTLAVGGYFDNSNVGAAWVFTRSGGVWSQQGGKLVGTGNVGASRQGQSIALSSDGNTMAIGGNIDNSNNGAVWIWTRSGGVWTQQGSKLTVTGNVGTAQFGASLDLSEDGNTLVGGGNTDDSSVGATWVFRRSGSTWTQYGSKMVGRGYTGSFAPQQGISSSISANGNVMVVGGWRDGTDIGAFWTFKKYADVWLQYSTKLVGTGSSGTIRQGTSIAIAKDGNTVIEIGAQSGGGVWFFNSTIPESTFSPTRSPTLPTLQPTLFPTSKSPSSSPTRLPTSKSPSRSPTTPTTLNPTLFPTLLPTIAPTVGGAFIQNGAKLVGTGRVGTGQQGRGVAISADGTTAAVGGAFDSSTTGAIWIYTRSGSTWTQQGSKLVGTGATGNAAQGEYVAISADGNTVAWSGMFDATFNGAVWVFTRTAGVWTQQGSKLVGSGGSGSFIAMGRGLSMSQDGNTIAFGATGDTSSAGATWVFTRSSGVWTQEGSKLVGTGAIGAAQQGYATALSADGRTLAVGGISDDSSIGAVWIFVKATTTWAQQGSKLVGTGGVGTPNQGISVALSADGNTLIVGGEVDDSIRGALWVFLRTGTAWAQQGAKLVGSGAVIPTRMGSSVSVSADGNFVIAGGYKDNTDAGAFWTFQRSSGSWSQVQNKLVGSGASANAQQGFSTIGLSMVGNHAVVGGWQDNSNIGAAWMWDATTPRPALSLYQQQGSKLVGTGGVGSPRHGSSVAISGDALTVAEGGVNDAGGFVGAVWIFTRSGATWTQQGSKLFGTGAVGSANQGTSIALSQNGNTVVWGGNFDDSNIGAVWVWIRTAGVWSQQGSKLVGTGLVGAASFGKSVSLSSDGDTLVVGASDDDTSIGCVHVFIRSAGVWSQQGSKLVGTGATGAAQQGTSVALSGDGNTLVLGGRTDNTNLGAAWVFTRSAGVWTQQGSKLVGTGAVGNSQQGISVSLSSNGDTLIVGGSADDISSGAIWVYTRSAGVWSQDGSKVIPTNQASTGVASGALGGSSSLSADGLTFVAGARTHQSGTGSLWVFQKISGIWTQQGSYYKGSGFTTPGAINMGITVSLSSNATHFVFGGPLDNFNQGASWVFGPLP